MYTNIYSTRKGGDLCKVSQSLCILQRAESRRPTISPPPLRLRIALQQFRSIRAPTMVEQGAGYSIGAVVLARELRCGRTDYHVAPEDMLRLGLAVRSPHPSPFPIPVSTTLPPSPSLTSFLTCMTSDGVWRKPPCKSAAKARVCKRTVTPVFGAQSAEAEHSFQ